MSDIFSALKNNDLSHLEKLLHDGEDVNKQDSRDWNRTILHKACVSKNSKAIKLILQYKPKINIKNKFGQTPLHLLCISGDVECVGLLVNHQGVDINLGDIHYQTPLYLATENNRLDVMKLLLEHGADPNIVTSHSYSPLHEARSDEAVKLLVKFGSNIHATDRLNDTVLTVSSHYGRTSVVQSVCELGGQVDHKGVGGQTALQQATYNGHISTVKYLLTQRPDVHILDNNKFTVLQLAHQKGKTEIVGLLATYIQNTEIKGDFLILQ